MFFFFKPFRNLLHVIKYPVDFAKSLSSKSLSNVAKYYYLKGSMIVKFYVVKQRIRNCLTTSSSCPRIWEGRVLWQYFYTLGTLIFQRNSMGRSWFIGSKVMNSGVTSLPFYKDCFSAINSYHTLGCFHENIHFSLVKTSRYLCKRVSPCTKFFSLKSNQKFGKCFSSLQTHALLAR